MQTSSIDFPLERETHGGVHGGGRVRVVVADPVVLADVLRLVVARVRVPLADLVAVVHLHAHRVTVLVHVRPCNEDEVA